MKTRAIYPGTFDPITNGHVDIIYRALNIFDEVIIGVANGDNKTPMFDIDKRVEMIESTFVDMPRVSVESFDTLLVDYAAKKDIFTIIRGLRVVSDFEYELQMGYANSSLNEKIDTVYLMPRLKNAFVSSSIVRSILNKGTCPKHLIPSGVVKYVCNS
ncbi:MAG: Phosphopantetheine adenylyltransferase (EC [uncultured Campylobacterales bacterium]|uniref:Phosphopantetheine adenylyltransferase n=1 Tax=uncultured Campylobacterales bacterium TaxID=352960 RepID=A0A6S6SZ90_9BACT|nr:MAG: Phosphopantetheine adenylyltransferase (EC [uncultured Campylobacterales bacterium]